MADSFVGRILQIELDDPDYGVTHGVAPERFIPINLLDACFRRIQRGRWTASEFRTFFDIQPGTAERTEFDMLLTKIQASVDGQVNAIEDMRAILVLWELKDDYAIPGHTTPVDITTELLALDDPSTL